MRGRLPADLTALLGHQVHVVRRREVGTLLRWISRDLSGVRLLDVGGGDGYWAGRARRRGAVAVCADIAMDKLRFGRSLKEHPHLLAADALRLPFPTASFDVVMSVCALEHFPDGERALSEMARVLRRGGDLVLSADSLTNANRWPQLTDGHRERYRVVRTYDEDALARLLEERGLRVLESRYLFRTPVSQWLYLQLSRQRLAWNAAAPLAVPVALMDRLARRSEGGSVVLVHARRVG